MRRFLTFFMLSLIPLPVGLSVAGCSKNTITYCTPGDSGLQLGQVSSVTLEPKTTGISLNYGATGQVGSPTAADCKGHTVGVGKYSYGTTDMTIADVSPTGALCGGTWNRNTGSGIADFTTCVPTNKTGVAVLTANGNGVTSNQVSIFVHPPVTSVSLSSPSSTTCSTQTDANRTTNCCPNQVENTSGVTPPPVYTGNTCLSQSLTGQLAALVLNGSQNISCSVGHLLFSPQDTNIVSIDQNGVATAEQPGSTVITATVAQATSTAGFFYTCPPASIKLSVPGVAGSTVLVNQANVQPLTATLVDTNNNPVVINNNGLEFVSTTVPTTTIGNSGLVNALFPGAATITAICQPAICNPSPFEQIGVQGNGKPIVSNPIQVVTPGTVQTILYIASTQSRYYVPVDFSTSTVGSPILLPYIPNSMVLSQNGSQLFLGSPQELMIVNALSNSLGKEDNNVPGTVLTVSPDGGTLVISDPVHNLLYLYNTSNGSYTSFGGTGTRAQYSPDSQAVYIVGQGKLYVYSNFTGWHIYDTSSTGSTDVAVTIPDVGAYIAGNTTTAHSYCADTTVNPSDYYPLADQATTPTDKLTATNDGKHILGATVSTAVPTLSDIAVTLPIGQCPPNGTGAKFSNNFTTTPLTGVSASSINYVVPATDSSVAFVTYFASSGAPSGSASLPAYRPVAGGPGVLTEIPLKGASAPTNGVFSADNQTFYTGTSGDNLVHIIDTKTLTDTRQINPQLVDPTGKTVVPDLLAARPRPTT